MKHVLALLAASLAAHGLAEEGSFDSNGVKIRYVSEGQGEAVVLVHGWMGDATMWGQDATGNPKPKAPEGFRVIALDCRGHGKSEKPHDPAKYGAEMAEDVVRLLDHLRIKKAHLIGYSMGAFIVGKVAATHPDRVISLIYGGQAPLLTGEAGSREIEALAKAVEEGKGLGPYLMEVRPALTREQADELAKFLYSGKDAKAWAVAGLSFRGLEVRREDLIACRVPTLFLYGSKEVESTKTRVAALRPLLVGCEETIVPGGDHTTTLLKPEFGAAILSFLRSHRGSDGL
ncbi:MAG: alpha/beta hydrolase [Fimbriimonadaceae bacterium]|nr:alpha/beta hydrolase [Fimbriimonadaceae bacterium]